MSNFQELAYLSTTKISLNSDWDICSHKMDNESLFSQTIHCTEHLWFRKHRYTCKNHLDSCLPWPFSAMPPCPSVCMPSCTGLFIEEKTQIIDTKISTCMSQTSCFIFTWERDMKWRGKVDMCFGIAIRYPHSVVWRKLKVNHPSVHKHTWKNHLQNMDLVKQILAKHVLSHGPKRWISSKQYILY